MLTKVFIVPWAGNYPDWMVHYLANIRRLEAHGYTWFFPPADLVSWRLDRMLGIKLDFEPGGSKLHDIRPLLGRLFTPELENLGATYWGFTDLDCVYGRVEHWVTDEFLTPLDVHSNHHSYMCGPWSLLRNCAETRTLFYSIPDWREQILHPNVTGWAEQSWSRAVEGALRFAYTYWQGNDGKDNPLDLHQDLDGKLWVGEEEVMMYHFRHTKQWPLRGE